MHILKAVWKIENWRAVRNISVSREPRNVHLGRGSGEHLRVCERLPTLSRCGMGI